MSPASKPPTVLYVHGAGAKPLPDDLKRSWDNDLFGQDRGGRTRMVYYADLLHPRPGSISADATTQDEVVATLVQGFTADTGEVPPELPATDEAGTAEEAALLAELTPRGRELTVGLALSIATQAASQPRTRGELTVAALPLPAPLRRLLLRQLLRQLVPDADRYFFTDRKEPIRDRLRQALDAVDGPVVVVAHSLGTVVAYEVLSERRFAGRAVPLLVTLGSPLGYTEIQDVVTAPHRSPAPVRLWANFADPRDVVTLDTTLADEFGRRRIIDTRVDNPAPNNHAVGGYLRASQVRSVVTAALTTRDPG